MPMLCYHAIRLRDGLLVICNHRVCHPCLSSQLTDALTDNDLLSDNCFLALIDKCSGYHSISEFPFFLAFLSVSFQFHRKFMIGSIVHMDAIRIDFVKYAARVSIVDGKGLNAEFSGFKIDVISINQMNYEFPKRR